MNTTPKMDNQIGNQYNKKEITKDVQKKDGTEYRYRYVLDCQGNVSQLVDTKDSIKVLRYSYDAFGVPTIEKELTIDLGGTTVKLSEVNPFTYRSYYWDQETKLYYLMTRYYDPDTGRFINADDISYLDP